MNTILKCIFYSMIFNCSWLINQLFSIWVHGDPNSNVIPQFNLVINLNFPNVLGLFHLHYLHQCQLSIIVALPKKKTFSNVIKPSQARWMNMLTYWSSRWTSWVSKQTGWVLIECNLVDLTGVTVNQLI